MRRDNARRCQELMLAFADRTGLSDSGNPPRRYLWTDAHAVCNFLSLYRHTGAARFEQLARSLVEQVHEVLGRHREDDSRSGWISGLDEEQGRKHPTAGGLRIGKPLGERGREEAFDERLEWDRDGQYFHYLAKWMHALSRTSAVTGDAKYMRWAIELAQAAHAGFSRAGSGTAPEGLAWKMSIDLSYPLVPSTGLHDALDAYVTYHELAARSAEMPIEDCVPSLDTPIAEVEALIGEPYPGTSDPLGIGGLLFDACRAIQLLILGRKHMPSLLPGLLDAASASLKSFPAQSLLGQPAAYRLAFREFGLSIGLRGIGKTARLLSEESGANERIRSRVALLREYAPLAGEVEQFWLEPAHRQASAWGEHRDINAVMLATSLLPDEFLRV